MKINIEAVRPCNNYRNDTEQCQSGCRNEGIKPQDICCYDIEMWDVKSLLQTECAGYR